MKCILTIFLIFSSWSALSNESEMMQQKILELEARIQKLEGQKKVTSGGLKVEDYGGKKAARDKTRVVASDSPDANSQPKEQISADQRKEIMDTLNNYKAKQAEAKEYLDELMNEN